MSARQARRAHGQRIERERAVVERRRRRAVMAAGAAVAGVVIFAPSAQAATFEVTTLDDTNDGTCDDECSLRDAVYDARDAAGNDTITFAAGLSGDIALTQQIQIGGVGDGEDLAIEGPGADQITVSGEGAGRVFKVFGFDQPGAQVSISGLTIANGSTSTGAAIYSNAFAKYFGPTPPTAPPVVASPPADLTLTDVVVRDNESTSGDGAVELTAFAFSKYNSTIEPVPYEAGTLTVNNSTLTGNSASGRGGAISINHSNGPSTIADSTIADNQAAYGGGLSFYSLYAGADSLQITNSTISGNEANGPNGVAGGVYLYGSGNQSSIDNTTIADNSATTFGGGVVGINGLDASPTISSSIVADNDAMYAPDVGADREPFVIDHSLIESYDGGGDASNIIGQDPQLGPLADNGGPTQTHLPALSSPAIDTGVGERPDHRPARPGPDRRPQRPPERLRRRHRHRLG